MEQRVALHHEILEVLAWISSFQMDFGSGLAAQDTFLEGDCCHFLLLEEEELCQDRS